MEAALRAKDTSKGKQIQNSQSATHSRTTKDEALKNLVRLAESERSDIL